MKLVIVETPAQAKTLSSILGESWHVEPCRGHLRDFRADKLGVDVENGFAPDFSTVPGKGGLVVRLKKLLRQADVIYTATPPGRSGELMAWHVLALAADSADKPVFRVELTALTPDVVRDAFRLPRPLDLRLIDAELTRRIVGRLISVGVNAAILTADEGTAPLPYTSMLGLRLVQDRERQIAGHKPQSCWMASAQLNVEGRSFTAKVLNAKGTPLALRTEAQADHLARILDPAVYWVESVIRGARTHPAPASLTVGALIETASRDLGLTPARVLSVLATLYEGGWIAHPDSHGLSGTREATLSFIRREYGLDCAASEIAGLVGLEPVDIARVPEDGSGDGAALYGLIRRHFIASHMTPSQESITAARIRVGPARDKKYPIELRATSRTTLFDGWTRVLKDRGQETADAWLTHLKEGAALHLERVDMRQVTRPAAQPYTESTLAHALADAGVSLTEAVAAIGHLHSTGLLASVDGSQTLTDAGQSLAQRLVEHFDDLTGMTCAEELAADIERVAAGETSRADVLRAFWSRYGERLSASEEVLL
jgi:DNA topoisomerase-1